METRVPLLAIGMLLASCGALAEPADYVYTPSVEYGEKEIDFKLGSAKKGEDPRQAAASVGFGYGAKEWWFTELYLKYKRENGEQTKFDAVEWENRFQLTETGRYPVDVGLLVELERPRDHGEGWEVKWGPLFQTEMGKVQLNFNTLFKRNYQADFSNDSRFQYQWQVKYRWLPQFEFGLQAFGDRQKWDDPAGANERTDRLGPAIFGKLPVGGRQTIKYNAAWLLGATKAAPDHTLRMQVEFEF